MMRTLIASNSEEAARDIRDCLVRQGVECRDEDTVALDRVLDRASRTMPELLVMVLPSEADAQGAGFRELRETCSTIQKVYVLAVGPATDPKLILRALREGAAEYLDQAQLKTELVGAMERLKVRRAARSASHAPGRVIGVVSPSGGSGSSMLAAGISTILAGQHQECGLLDLRLTAGDLSSMLDLKPAHTLADFCDRASRVDHSMFEQFFARHRSGVWLLAAPARQADVCRVTPRAVRQMLAMARVRFPYVVADLEHRLGDVEAEALWQSDLIVVVLRLDYTSVRNTRRVLDGFMDLGIGVEHVVLAANACGQRRQLRVRQAEEALGMKITHCIPNDPARVNRAINRGVPVTLYYPGATVSKSIATLTGRLNGRPPGGEVDRQ